MTPIRRGSSTARPRVAIQDAGDSVHPTEYAGTAPGDSEGQRASRLGPCALSFAGAPGCARRAPPGEPADRELHDAAHQRHRLRQHIGCLRREHAVNRFADNQTPTFGVCDASFIGLRDRLSIMSASGRTKTRPAASDTTTLTQLFVTVGRRGETHVCRRRVRETEAGPAQVYMTASQLSAGPEACVTTMHPRVMNANRHVHCQTA